MKVPFPKKKKKKKKKGEEIIDLDYGFCLKHACSSLYEVT